MSLNRKARDIDYIALTHKLSPKIWSVNLFNTYL